MAEITEIEASMALNSADLDLVGAAMPGERSSLPGFVLSEGRSGSGDDGSGSSTGKEGPGRWKTAIGKYGVDFPLEKLARGEKVRVEERLEGFSHRLASSV